VYVLLLSGRRCAGVFFGLDFDHEYRVPTTHPPQGAVGFLIFSKQLMIWSWLTTVNCSKSAGGEAVNAQVCKTCIRGFNSRPALQIQ
jgi:hypothetical protein